MRSLFIVTIVVVVAMTFSISGCAPREIAQAPGEPVETQPPITQVQPYIEVRGDDRQQVETPEVTVTKEIPREDIVERRLMQVHPVDPEPLVKELQINIQDVLFDFDRYDIRDDAKPVLKELAATLLNNRNIKIIIEGHADNRGTNEYNFGLGDRRANSVREYLIVFGISSGRIETISYGEERPVCNEQTEECWAKNRRAHFVLIDGGR